MVPSPVSSRILSTPPGSLVDVELCVAAWRLKLTEQFDELLCLPHLRGVQRLDYQVETVLKVLRLLRGRALLADEVGLGKTIEASMLILEMRLRGMASRVLVLVPSALVGQWTEELREKFQIPARSTEEPAFRSKNPAAAWHAPGVLVASLHLAKLERHARFVAEAPWDLVAVDEAHHVKNRATAGWRLINQLKSRFLLLITATPVETDLEELYNLITLLKPGQLSTPADFKKRFVSAGDPLNPKNRERLRALLAEVMVRNTRARAGLSVALPPRFARTLVVEPTPAELALYQAILEEVRRRATAPAATRHHLRFLMEAAGSSPHAALHTLLRSASDDSPEEEPSTEVPTPATGTLRLLELARAAASAPSRKTERLMDVLAQSPGKVVVFSRFKATLEALSQALQARGLSFVSFHGGMSGPQKDQAVEAFREQARVLLATEVGGEGRNLQFANVLVNFDLPWNPMKIEQRIGRLHRIGQQHEVHIFSLCNAQSAEERILDVLDRRIHLFELVVGEVDLILGRALGEKEFDERVFDIYASTGDEPALQKEFEALAEELASARRGYEQVKALDEKLFAEDFET
ncbi:DEAD/DEAH box helicase [Hyalangium sp.]|uniref:DEAD/DEAH box helicase n=1 Tax=Hyalangium sp. TaxID=2028555 RepID=UPI002D731B4A|nr:SNF2-related protein [Hyalangium sp.]HYH95362.1 SNF2-related protein [Hyalangium sp.]